MAKKQKNDRVCPICLRKFRVNLKKGNTRKYCSKECSVEANRNRANRRNNLGTPSTLSLSHKNVKYQLYLIRNNIDKGAQNFLDKSKRDIVLEHMCFDEDKKYIVEV